MTTEWIIGKVNRTILFGLLATPYRQWGVDPIKRKRLESYKAAVALSDKSECLRGNRTLKLTNIGYRIFGPFAMISIMSPLLEATIPNIWALLIAFLLMPTPLCLTAIVDLISLDRRLSANHRTDSRYRIAVRSKAEFSTINAHLLAVWLHFAPLSALIPMMYSICSAGCLPFDSFLDYDGSLPNAVIQSISDGSLPDMVSDWRIAVFKVLVIAIGLFSAWFYRAPHHVIEKYEYHKGFTS